MANFVDLSLYHFDNQRFSVQYVLSGEKTLFNKCLSQPFPKQALVFTCLQYKSFENTVGKGEIAHNEQFLLFPQCFLPVWRSFCHFHQI